MRFTLGLLTILTSYATNTHTDISPGIRTCLDIQSTLGTSIVVSTGDQYRDTITNTWNLFNSELQPACIIYPRESHHVQTAMEAIYQNNIRYAVQAGSHSAMKGWNKQDGILISFSYMKNISYDPIKDTITLQPGIHWDEAIASVESQGVAPSGGRVGDVGTGLLLGGGLSYLSPEYGFSADSFKELDVVLVTGELVTATATNGYSDLFRALKGGANRFGIVTRYEVYAIHTGTKEEKRWYGGLILYPDSSAEALVNATAKFVRDVKDPKAAMLTILGYTMDQNSLVPAHVAVLFYRGIELPPRIFGDFLDVPTTARYLGPSSYSDAAATLTGGIARGRGQLFGASALEGANANYLNAYRHWKNFTLSFPNDIDSSIIAFTPISDIQVKAGRERGGNAIDPPRGGYAAVQLHMEFPAGVMDVPHEVRRGRELLFQQVPRSPGLPLYINECHKEQEVFETYGGYEFLKRTYAKYDPARFNIRYTDGPMGL